MSKIIVYADRGVDGMALKQLIKSLQETIDPSAHILKRMDAKSLLEESWEKDSSLVVIPGGRDVFYHEALDGRGTDKLRAFVRNGGNYFGICAGAYFACSSIEFQKGGLLEVCAKRSLQFFPGAAIGPAYGPDKYSYEPEHRLRGAVAAKISWKEGEHRIYFNGGCAFHLNEHDPSVLPLSCYLDLPEQPLAMVEVPFGNGLALLSGVHPEYSPHYLNPEDPYASDLFPLLIKSENNRKLLFKELLERLGIQTVDKTLLFS